MPEADPYLEPVRDVRCQRAGAYSANTGRRTRRAGSRGGMAGVRLRPSVHRDRDPAGVSRPRAVRWPRLGRDERPSAVDGEGAARLRAAAVMDALRLWRVFGVE